MAIQKSKAKGRLDKYYKLAKEKGYRARAAFKLIQLDKRFGFLKQSKVILDLCAAPGSWSQVCAESMPKGSLIIGVDLAPIKPIPNVINIQGDITTDKTRAAIRGHMKSWRADVVLHDGAPNVGTAWDQDAYDQARLVLHSLKLGTEFLIEGGTFVTKIFRSKDYNSLIWVFSQLFNSVTATKPPSSRNVSAEIFVVCKGFKAPKRIDPRLLDPRSVFQELENGALEAKAQPKVFRPEIKTRSREGYDEGNITQFKEVSASEFIKTADPISILSSANRLSFKSNGSTDEALAMALDELPDTTPEVRSCAEDLKVLGRKDFKLLLTWRLKVRDLLGFSAKKVDDEVVEIEPMDDKLTEQEELANLALKEGVKRKRARRRENEKKRKEIVRMQMNMIVPTDIVEDDPKGEGKMFRLESIDGQRDAMKRIAKEKMATLTAPVEAKNDHSGESDVESDDDEDRLDRELDEQYEQFKERVANKSTKHRAKMTREENDDSEWKDRPASENEGSDSDEEILQEDSSDDSDDDVEQPPQKKLFRDFDDTPSDAAELSKRARNFFSQEIFNDIPGMLEAPQEDGEDAEVGKGPGLKEKANGKSKREMDEERSASSEDDIPSISKQKMMNASIKISEKEDTDDFEVVKQTQSENNADNDWEENERNQTKENSDIDIITAEAMTLAHQIATGQKPKSDLIDDGFNRYSHRDRDGLPEWFLEDESKHDKPIRPVTKAAAQVIKDKLRAYNARPIKKVREAKARKKLKVARRLEKMKKKNADLIEAEGMTEREKAGELAKMIAKAGKSSKMKRRVTVVKATSHIGRSRPSGVKGRYKMVDPRMRKETRAMKRKAQKMKKGR